MNILAKPDGTSGAFAIPPSSVLIVTSFDYAITTTPSVPNLAFSGGVAGSNGRLVGSAAIPGGFVVKPPAILCVQGGSGFNSALVAVHGFFTKAK